MQDRSSSFRSAIAGGLVVAFAMTALPVLAASVGDPFALGEVNIINSKTVLRGAAGKTLQLRNTGTGFPLQLNAPDGKAPLKVNNSELVKRFNADLLDGLDSTALQVVAAHDGGEQIEGLTGTPDVVRSVTLTAPSDGMVIVNSTVTGVDSDAGDKVQCSITTGTILDLDFLQQWDSPGSPGFFGQLAGTRGFDVTAGELTVNLVCKHAGSGDSSIFDSAMTAIFIPT